MNTPSTTFLPTRGSRRSGRSHWLPWAASVAFVVYGSLIPFHWMPMALAGAWQRFQQMPVLEIGAEHRADWIANIVLYLPVGFFSAHGLLRSWPRQPRLPLLLLATLVSFALAVAVEFAQIWFPPRTVALNDLLAEAIGSLAGVALAARSSQSFDRMLQASPLRTQRIDPGWLALYAAGYLLLSLFPYDIVLSTDELALKVAGPDWGWLAARPSHGRAIGLLKLGAEVLLTLPIGWWLGATQRRPPTTAAAFGWGAALGLVIEIGQFFMLSGSSQGLSVLSRGLGTLLGAKIWSHRAGWRPLAVQTALRRHLGWLVAIQGLLILQVNHWIAYPWAPAAAASASWAALPLMPFYYFYYTSELSALASLAAVSLLYAPIGLWTWTLDRSRGLAALVALAVAAAVEAGKLWIPHAHPDPTDPLIAAAAAWTMAALMAALAQDAQAGRGVAPASAKPSAAAPIAAFDAGEHITRPPSPAATGSPLRYAAWLLAMAAVAGFVVDFPLAPALLGALLAGVSILVWQRPALAFAVAAAALPVLDLAPWSGRVVVDEFDALLAVCLATACARTTPAPAARPDGWWRAAMVLAGVALVASVAHAMWPWTDADGASLETLRGPLATLRVAKGAVWALVAGWIWRRVAWRDADTWQMLARGIATGVALTVAVIVWERATFASVLDFADDYRVTGPFSAMHLGGAYVETYLVTGMPFVLVLTLEARQASSRVLGAALLGATAYAVAVTFSRSGAAAALVASAVMAIAVLRRTSTDRKLRLGRLLGIGAVVVALVAPAVFGPFMQSRFASVRADLAARRTHWRNVIAARPTDRATQLLGTGPGRFAEAFYWSRDAADRAGSFRVHLESTDPYLRLGGGKPLYVEQFVGLQPQRDYVLTMEGRAPRPGAEIVVTLCEKALLDSFDCVRRRAIAPAGGDWQRLEFRIASRALGAGPWYAARPVKLSLRTPAAGSSFDVRRIALRSAEGNASHIDNGDFAAGMDHWYFSADDHLAWHTKSLPLALWFEWGWLGVAGFGALATTAIVRGSRHSLAATIAPIERVRTSAGLAALAGFLVIGTVDSLIDTPRFLLIVLALCALCVTRVADPTLSGRGLARPVQRGP